MKNWKIMTFSLLVTFLVSCKISYFRSTELNAYPRKIIDIISKNVLQENTKIILLIKSDALNWNTREILFYKYNEDKVFSIDKNIFYDKIMYTANKNQSDYLIIRKFKDNDSLLTRKYQNTACHGCNSYSVYLFFWKWR